MESSGIPIIKISDCLNKNLSLRIYADNFFEHIKTLDQNDLIVDFDGVVSVSRSFTQQFLNLMKVCGKRIVIINQSEEIKTIFNVVKSPRKRAKIL
jgi:anti-anti-sigma regulatory factor